jgi:hypothetical protein
MNAILRSTLGACLLTGALPLVSASEPPPVPPPGVRRLDKPTPGDRPGAKREMERVTYLGVVVSPAGPTIGAQLGLPREVGLVVNSVERDSPAAAVLKEHDVLTKLDDQILIDPHQFTVLIRSRKDGDEITLTLHRGGKETTVKAKLARREVPKTAFDHLVPGGATIPHIQLFHGGPGPNLPGGSREDADRVMRILQDARKPGNPPLRTIIERRRVQGDGRGATIVDLPRSNVVFSDDAGVIELRVDGGQRELTAKNTKGDVLFAGPINTDDERRKVPAEVLVRLDKLERMDGLDFHLREGVRPEAGAVNLPEMRQPIALPVVPRSGPVDPAAQPF